MNNNKKDIKVSKNIIRYEQPHLVSVNIPNEEFDYFWIDFCSYPKGYEHKKPLGRCNKLTYEDDEIKLAKHQFRICLSSYDIDGLIKQLQDAKNKSSLR